jgi:hypothetical protein
MFLDIGAGVLFSIFIARTLDISMSLLFPIMGALFVLLPDIDMLIYWYRTRVIKKPQDDHRSWTHYPVVYVPISILVYVTFGLFYGTLFTACIYFHLIHDTVWLGWGISWLWPISSRKFKCFPDKHGEISSQVLMTWTKDEEASIFTKYHNPDWVRNFYLRPNIVAYTEYSVFILSLITLYFSL